MPGEVGVIPCPLPQVSRARSAGGALAAVLAACLLAACGTTPPREAERAPAAAAPAKPPTAGAETPRKGGYYKDDGPGDNPPPDLDSIPDAQPRREPLHRFANRPYNVFGRDYVPATTLAPYRERGRASWYGRRFHGARTSSGEPYDMYGMTAAHPTLPIPSYVRVTNLANGKSVVVRINDRGPFHKDRIIDLSYTAAYRLGYVNAGSAMVEIESILPDEGDMVAGSEVSPPPGRTPVASVQATPAVTTDSIAAAPVAAPVVADGGRTGGVFLQLGAFASQANAESFRNMVKQELAALADRLELRADGGRFRLHAGPYASVAEAQAAAEEIGAVLKLRPFVVTP